MGIVAALAIGAVAFIAGVFLSPQRAWQAYFVNFLFWSGIAQGGVVMAAVYRLTNARWGDQFRRIGEGMIGFLPVSLLLYLMLIAGGTYLFPWLVYRVPGNEVWLSGYFVFGRDGAAQLVLLLVSYRFVYHSLRPDLGLLNEQGLIPDRRVLFVIREWKGWPEESAESKRRLAKLTPILLLCFGTLYTLLGFDLVMALDPTWYSTLFGWMYFLHAFFASLAIITILAFLSTKWFQLKDAFLTRQWHDMGRFIFGFALLAGGFFWSQFLVIWYGNLPEESSYLIKRFYTQPWEPLMWVYIILAYLFPLVVFLSARIKQIPAALSAIAGLILVGLFLERFVSVIPFIWNLPTVPFGILEVGITLGFAALFLGCWLEFARVAPIVPPRPDALAPAPYAESASAAS
jgi:hypothetical protein